MKVLVLGASGMLGTDLVQELKASGHEVLTPTSKELDIVDPGSVAQMADMSGLDWAINCAAYTAVDKAEEEVQPATELNALAPGYLARVCAMSSINFAHISTDFVFDGEATEPYSEDAPTHPQSVYGRTKREGEEAVIAANPMSLVFRTAWLYGAQGKSFPRTLINAWLAGKNLRVVADQVGSPTCTIDLAKSIRLSIEKDIFPGIYHATGPDQMSWYAFAHLAIEVYREYKGMDKSIEMEPIRTQDWPTPAKRPKFSVLSNQKLQQAGVPSMRPTAACLAEFVRNLV
ncbi:MAG: dTDP-4-dehydrorhamnose reductase [Armatimonadetes bacterium 55-13]|nr:dTDP-4-dehydrorhamnose reductase [Armatimonadota bacterium]OJU65516.1 MAG: dTDP-4-dehydrorhamnose reductase [Armatimonadetes bacterium 55-13]